MRSTCSAVRISSGLQGLVSRGRGASEGPVERWARPRSRRRDVAGTSLMAGLAKVGAIGTALCRFRAPSFVYSAVRDDYPIEGPQMQCVVRSVGMTWALARRVGPYLMLEILLPGGTLVAVLLFLYRHRQLHGATGARRARGTAHRESRAAGAALLSQRDFRNSTIAC